jgi:hypothetical protein
MPTNDEGGLFLVGVHLSFGNEMKVTLALAEVQKERLVPSATNVVVVFADVPIP